MNITVIADTLTGGTGRLTCGDFTCACTLGRTGVIPAVEKREGDGKTPLGTYPLRYAYYRADRGPAPISDLALRVLTPDTGWCEDPTHPDYNRPVTLPHPAACDVMTRDDHLYDICVVLGHNDAPAVPYLGSAIFMHLAREDFTPTAGCVGVRRGDLLEILARINPNSTVTILPPAT